MNKQFFECRKLLFKLASFVCMIISGCCSCQKREQEDPCKIKSRVVGDVQYCDRYWECVDGQPELYDCPNGLVFAGKSRGVTEGCDYPWRETYCVGKQSASKFTLLLYFSLLNFMLP